MTSRRIPTKQELLQLQKLYRTDKKIAQAMGGVSEQLIAYWRRKKGVGKSIFPKYTFMEIKELWERYGDDAKAGAEMQITKQAFYRWRKKYKLLEKPTILKLEQLEFKFFDEQRHNRGARSEVPAQTYLQKIASYHQDNRFVKINESIEVIPDMIVRSADDGLHIDSKGNTESFHSPEDAFAAGYFQPGRIIAVDSPQGAIFSVTSSLVQVCSLEKLKSATAKQTINIPIVPTIRITLSGTHQTKHTPLDSASLVWEALRNSQSQSFCIEICGVERLTLEERMSFLAYAQLLTRKNVILEPDQTFLNYVSQYSAGRWPVPFSDKNVYFLDDLNVAVARPRPFIYALGRGEFVSDIAEFQDIKLKRIRIGPILGGTLEDFRAVAVGLKDNAIKSGIELFILPRSKAVFVEALKRKYVQKIVEAGGFVGNLATQVPMSALAKSDYELTTEININAPGHYLASVPTIAQTLVSGKITKRGFEIPD